MSRSTSASTRGLGSLRSAIFITVVLLGTIVAPSLSLAAAYPNFVFSGSGYGHGIGLSQYGAKGYAENGKSGTWIVSHYFPGTTLRKPAAKTIKVNLDPAANYTAVSTSYNGGYTAASWKVRAGTAGMAISINGGPSLPDTRAPFTFAAASGKVSVTDNDGDKVSGSPFSGTVTVTMKGSASPALLQVVGRSGPFKSSSVTPSTDVRYRGSFLISANGSKLKLLNQLKMEEYLYGVVPRESPSSWHLEALKAQAIVARSYAYVSRSELYCDTRSQMYNGHSRGSRSAPVMHEAERSNEAVAATAGTCVDYQGNIVATYFSASSGGYTANHLDVWGGTTQIPYLKGVPDPYGEGSYDPWSKSVMVTLDGMELAKAIRGRIVGEPIGAGTTVHVKSLSIEHVWPSGFARRVTVNWSDGSSTSGISGTTWRQALDLRSNKFFSNAYGDRISGDDRHARSVAASKYAFPTASSAKSVIVVNADGTSFADAACGSALSGVAQGPVLFVHKGSVPAEVTAEIERLSPSKLYIIGNTAVVSSSVESKLKGLVPATERLAGKDRYATSAAVARKARQLGATPARAVVVSGTSWREVAVAAAIAGGAKRPLLLTTPTALSGSASAVLKEFKTTKSYVVGSDASISKSTVASVLKITKETKPTKRLGLTGTIYDLAVEAANYERSSLGFSAERVFAPSSYSMPDAMIASALSSATKHPFVFASTYTPPAATRAYLSANRHLVKGVIVVGRPTTVGLATGMRLMSDAY